MCSIFFSTTAKVNFTQVLCIVTVKMLILNNDLIWKWSKIQTSNKFSKKSQDDLQEKDATKWTHLYLDDKRISSIGDISQFTTVSTVYLHNNLLSSSHNLGVLTNLTHLYLQRNKIGVLSGFERLTKLQKLYLGYNEISMVEGLEHQTNLQLLHIEHQKLEPGATLCFDPRTLRTLESCCHDLDISHNRIASIIDLQHLRSLKHVNLAGNDLVNLKEVCSTVQGWSSVVNLELGDNPVCKDKSYPNPVLIASPVTLKTLDGKPVSPVTRTFLRKFEQEKAKRRTSVSNNVADVFSAEVKHLVKHLPEGLCQSVSGQILGETISGGPYHPVPITFPLTELVPRTEFKLGLRGSKPRRVVPKINKPTSEEPKFKFDFSKTNNNTSHDPFQFDFSKSVKEMQGL